MSEIGKFRSTNTIDLLAELIGTVRTMNFIGRLAITRETNAGNANAPTHRVYVISEDAQRIEVGAAWTQIIKRGAREGEEFLSVTVDDPSWQQSLSFSVFRDDETTWVATWRRRQSAA